MKRFLLFAYCSYYPSGGSNDVQEQFDSLEAARAYVKAEPWWDSVEVLDLDERKWITLK